MSEPEHEHDEETEAPISPETAVDDAEVEEAEEHAHAAETGAHEAEDVPEASGPTPEQWDERFKKADKAFKTYTNAVGRIFEEEANDYLPCPLCSDTPAGFVHPMNVGKFPEEVVGAVMVVLGQTAAGDVPADPYSKLCQTCQGWGVVATGSRVPNQDTRTCLDCRGVGYIADGPERSNLVALDTGSSQPSNGVTVPAATGPESPEIEALRLRGYTIVPPMQTGS